MNLDYRVSTSVNGQIVIQELDMPSLIDPEDEGRREMLYRRIMNLEERGIREALISLGWTPPKDEAA